MASRALWCSTTMLSGVVGATFFATLSAGAADLLYKGPYSKADVPLSGPAVDGFTSKIDAFGGTLSDKGIFGVRGSFSLPVGVQYGLQFDGTAGSYAGDFFGALGAHLFWRDPGRGLIGVYLLAHLLGSLRRIVREPPRRGSRILFGPLDGPGHRWR